MKTVAIMEEQADTIITYTMSDSEFAHLLNEVEKYPEVTPRRIVVTMINSVRSGVRPSDKPNCVGRNVYDAVLS